jgi:hypothetical protein
MATLAMPRTTGRFGGLQIAISVLVGLTALVHVAIGAYTNVIVATDPKLTASMGGATALDVMAALFYLCGLGYVALTIALYLPVLHRFRRLTRTALIIFTAGTILAYFALAYAHLDPFGLADKACEAGLIALLVVDGRRARR